MFGIVVSADTSLEIFRTVLVAVALFVVIWKTRGNIRKSDLNPINVEIVRHGEQIKYTGQLVEKHIDDVNRKVADMAKQADLMDLVGKVGLNVTQLSEFRREVSDMVKRNEEASERVESRIERMENWLMDPARRHNS